MKLIQIKDYLLLIDEEAVCKTGELYLTYIQDRIIPKCKGEIQVGDKIIAYLPINSEAQELDLPLLPPFEDTIPNSGYEEGMHGYTDTEVRVAQNAFKAGYKRAQQSNKQFSLEDMKKAIKMATYINPSDTSRFYSSEEIIQSLSTQQLPKQFSLEDMIAFGKKCFYKGFDKSENDDANCFTAWKEEANELLQSLSTQQLPKEFEPIMYPKYTQYDGFEEDDEIPVMTPMTSTNSEGKQELVGVYKY
jgi:hypothetical protein